MANPSKKEEWLQRLRQAGIQEDWSLYIFAAILFEWMESMSDLPERMAIAADKCWLTGRQIIDAALTRLEAFVTNLKQLSSLIQSWINAANAAAEACKKVPQQVTIRIDEDHVRKQVALIVDQVLDQWVRDGSLRGAVNHKFQESLAEWSDTAIEMKSVATDIKASMPVYKELAENLRATFMITVALVLVGMGGGVFGFLLARHTQHEQSPSSSYTPSAHTAETGN